MRDNKKNISIPLEYDPKTNNVFMGKLVDHLKYANTIHYKAEKYWKKDNEKYIEETKKGICTSQWGHSWNGYFPWKSFAYPNMDTTYWFYSLDCSNEENISVLPIIRLRGKFPHCRYYSYNLYDNSTGFAYGDGILDKDIKPDKGSFNPFKSGVDRSVEKRDFTLWLISESLKDSDVFKELMKEYGKANIIIIPNNISKPAVALRVYLPDSGYKIHGQKNDDIALPIIESFDSSCKTLEEVISTPTSCPPAYNTNVKFFLSLAGNNKDVERVDPEKDIFKEISFLRAPGGGQWPTVHNIYAGTPIRPYTISESAKGYGEIIELQFKVPSTPKTLSGKEKFNHNFHDMRYWSISMNNFDSTIGMRAYNDETVATYKDEKGNLWVHMIIAPNTSEIKDFIKENMKNITFLPYDGAQIGAKITKKTIRRIPTIIHRNLLINSNFKYGYNSVRERLEKIHGERVKKYFADKYIGSYAPTGKYYTKEEFFKKYSKINSNEKSI